MDKVHNILFTLFKSLIAELDLETIIEMNKSLVESQRFNFMVHSESNSGIRSKQKIVLVSLTCFQEIISILKTKLANAKKEDERVLMMFEGIVEFILREMYGSSASITEKIYKLLEEILIIRADMEEMVGRSLFSCIKANYSQMTQEKTKEFLQLVLNKINPRVFIDILV